MTTRQRGIWPFLTAFCLPPTAVSPTACLLAVCGLPVQLLVSLPCLNLLRASGRPRKVPVLPTAPPEEAVVAVAEEEEEGG